MKPNLIPARRWQKQAGLCEFEANQIYKDSSEQPGLYYTKKTGLGKKKVKDSNAYKLICSAALLSYDIKSHQK